MLREFIKLNVYTHTMIKNVKLVELNTKILEHTNFKYDSVE